jgi:hypothetical protein
VEFLIPQLGKKFLSFYGTPEVHYFVHKRRPLDTILNPESVFFHHVYLRSILILSFQVLGFTRGLFSLGLATFICIIFVVCGTSHVYPMPFDLIALIISGEEYKV